MKIIAVVYNFEQKNVITQTVQSLYNFISTLVSEALELSNFMEKVQKHETDTNCKELEELALQDWARLWRQILKDLRTGIKLKKVNYTKTPIEFELTPYEILMEDIRAKRYSLNKIMVDGELPQRIKKDAHDIILQFIRTRPPLKPVRHILHKFPNQPLKF